MATVLDAMKKAQAEQSASLPTIEPMSAATALAAPASETEEAGQPAAAAEPSTVAPAGDKPAAFQAAHTQVRASSPAPTNNYSPLLQAHHDRGGTVAEQFRHVRTSLTAQYPDQRFALLVTSAETGEGKTVSTGNLGVIMAERQDRTTLIVDCDMRHSKLTALFHAQDAPGMADLLKGRATLQQCIQPTVYPNLFIISAGQATRDGISELISRPELEEVVAQFRMRFDYVLVDSPPVNSVSDAGVLGRAMGEALMIVRMNKTNKDSVERAVRLLKAANVKVAGLVLTHQKYSVPKYPHRY